MYYPNSIEEICYDKEHIESVLLEINRNFHHYFSKYIETEAGHSIVGEDIKKLAEKFGSPLSIKNPKNKWEVFSQIISDSYADYEKDRQKYLEILNIESLEENKDDPPYFKNTILKNNCPIIRATLQNKQAKELDKYRYEFRMSKPDKLLEVVINLLKFATEYNTSIYNPDNYESIENIKDLYLTELQEEKYFVFGVIGGGIKSHFLYKLYPYIFPNRSRDAIWAMWYLTSKKSFKCSQDSEFLMIKKKENITQQNYFYPYDLFAFYALKIYLLLKNEAIKQDITLQSNYRYVVLDSFLSFVAQHHISEINELKKKVTDDGHGY